jgi:hypothetical protein
MDYIQHSEPSEIDYREQQQQEDSGQKNEKRSKRPRYFPSNKPQTFIKNAVTGVPYPYVVGAKEQSLLYKIVDATGRCDPDGYLIQSRNDLPNHNTNHLFYDSPEQCMSHMRLTLNPADIKRWHDRHSQTQEF